MQRWHHVSRSFLSTKTQWTLAQDSPLFSWKTKFHQAEKTCSWEYEKSRQKFRIKKSRNTPQQRIAGYLFHSVQHRWWPQFPSSEVSTWTIKLLSTTTTRSKEASYSPDIAWLLRSPKRFGFSDLYPKPACIVSQSNR